MSELKSFIVLYDGKFIRAYEESEADAVIVELEESHKKEVGQLLIKIAEQKSEIERLEILCANYIHDCDNLAISNEQVKRAASTLLKKMNHHKYKRCLAMADKCVDLCHKAKDLYRWAEDENLEHHYNRKIEFFARWHQRWLKIAEQFKEAK